MSNKPNFKHRTRPRPVRPAEAAQPSKRIWESPIAWVVGLIAVALVVTITLSVTGGSDDTPVAGETAFAEIIGPPLPDLGVPDTAVGADVPVIAAQTLEGERVRVGDDGIARVYGFFAHWCPHCRAELPRMVDWLETNELPAGVELTVISTAVDPTATNYPPSEWFAREGYPGEVLVDSDTGALANGFGLTGFPFWVAADADGRVVQRTSGELSTSQFEALLATVTPADDTAAAAAASGVRVVTPTEAAAIAADPPTGLTVLDVRTAEEFAEGHIEGATMIDFYSPDFADQIAGLDRDTPYVLYCRSGNRSSQTRALMAELGFTDVADIEGGVLNWIDAGLPVVTP